ncbi:hypothetical protein [Labrys wisconsinensis]|uniref:Uncharacterized protein n=1 Tax=Labrys wisconsinensis TaxID=425677 RepID=A0ABU0JAU2_9HYPH|nr:hypothetical protein [Labrys wisconsinensis]MDQ0471381.1 hypothetical protein [Labrys wisconsinensis]
MSCATKGVTAGLVVLKAMHNLSDDVLCERRMGPPCDPVFAAENHAGTARHSDARR